MTEKFPMASQPALSSVPAVSEGTLRRLVLAAGVAAMVALGSGFASAADMPAREMYTKAAPIVVDPWTGWYLGASAGGRWNKDTWTATGFELPASPGALSATNIPQNFSSSSGRFGLYGGYNWQVQRSWVVGLEADFAWATNKSSFGAIPGLSPAFAGAHDSVQMKDGWDGGVRGRLGYLITPTTQLFGTGGVSWMQSQASVTCGSAPTWCSATNATAGRTDSVSKTVVGWTLGGGLETVVMSDWLLRGEYRYASYGGYHATLLRGGSVGNGNADVVDADIGRIRTQTVLIGLARRF